MTLIKYIIKGIVVICQYILGLPSNLLQRISKFRAKRKVVNGIIEEKDSLINHNVFQSDVKNMEETDVIITMTGHQGSINR